jgi:gamma-glutamyltranspeptidase/glutathione hydrolase
VVDPKTRAIEMVAGGSGGPRIISATVQTLLNAIVFDMDAEEAVSAARVHHQWLPDQLVLEPAWSLDAPEGEMGIAELQEMMRRVERVNAFRNALESRGHRLVESESIGVVQFIRRRGDGFQGASDPRKGGAAVGIAEAPELEGAGRGG